MSKLEFVYISQKGDREAVAQHVEQLADKSNQEVVDLYNRQVKIGVVAVRAQMLYLVALRLLMIERFGDSPIYINDGYILGVGGQIVLNDDVTSYSNVEDK